MTDPVTVARRVVDEYERMDDWNKPRTRSGKEVPPSRVTLARAVIDLTAKVELRDKALEAVLELHKPIQASMTSNGGVSDVTVCDHCLDPTWPCQTVAAITTPLEEDHA